MQSLLIAWSLLLHFLSIGKAAASKNGSEFDYVIVGGGTAGLIVANRLSANPKITVAVIEAGDSVFDNPNVKNVTTFGLSLGTSIDWQYPTAPQVYSQNKTFIYDSGKALGGTSTINGMTYLRAEDIQIDAWERLGNNGWNWASLFPFYKKSESFVPPTPQQAAGGAVYEPAAHGFEGPLNVGWSSYYMGGNVSAVLRAAFEAGGAPYNVEPNNGTMRGFSVWPRTLDATKDIREDAARAYYWPIAASRKNLIVFTNTNASRIVWKEDSKSDLVARGVEVIPATGQKSMIRARREVILSAGSLRSPALLELSGIGNPAILKPLGIDVVLPLATVGENLQDQPNVLMGWAANRNFTGYPTFVTMSTAEDLFSTALTSVASEVRAKLPALASSIASQSRDSTTAAIQERLLAIQTDLVFGANNTGSSVPIAELLPAPTAQGLIVNPFWTLLPYSRGHVHIDSIDPLKFPVMNPNFWMSDIDVTIQAAAARVLRKAYATKPLSDWVVAEALPGLKTVPENATDEAWGSWFKSVYGPNYHPIGTCAMMARELGGVVDPELKVYGTKNVRVIDGSVLPMQTSGHLTSTIYAVAERASELILQSHSSGV